MVCALIWVKLLQGEHRTHRWDLGRWDLGTRSAVLGEPTRQDPPSGISHMTALTGVTSSEFAT